MNKAKTTSKRKWYRGERPEASRKNYALLPEGPDYPENARNMDPERETVERLRVVAFDASERRSTPAEDRDRYGAGFPQVVDAWFYMGRSSGASVIYCSVWIRTRTGDYLSGCGSAGGGGYHKSSAALEDALRSAGVELAASIGGVGEAAMREAVLAVARAAGYKGLPLAVLS